MTPEGLQYACDLLNRGRERTDSAVQRCKVGKLCGGRCIPRSHKCLANGQMGEHEGERKGMHPAVKNTLMTLGGITVANAVVGAGAAVALAVHEHGQRKEAEEASKKRKSPDNPMNAPSVKIMNENRAKRVRTYLEKE